MERFIIISTQSLAVFFDVTAEDAESAIVMGESSIGADDTDYEVCTADDVNSLWKVYRAPSDFRQVTADDAGLVDDVCDYIATFKRAV